MTRSTISPLRRFAAAAALAGVTGCGAVALAPAASAAPSGPAAAATAATSSHSLPDPANASSRIVSPLPGVPIEATIGPFTVQLSGLAAQIYQTVEANKDLRAGIAFRFDDDGVLRVECDVTKPLELQPAGCLMPTGSRF